MGEPATGYRQQHANIRPVGSDRVGEGGSGHGLERRNDGQNCRLAEVYPIASPPIDESPERLSSSREKGRDPSVEVAVGAQNDLMVGSDERQLAAPHDRPPNRVPIDVNMNPRLAGRRQ